jgi:protein TonB
MMSYADNPPDRLTPGLLTAVLLHAAVAAILVAFAVFHPTGHRLGEDSASVGAIQASMVSAIPLPSNAPPVKDSVLASEDTNIAPVPPKAATQPPPLPTDLLIKGRIDPHTKIADVPTLPPKHPQPTRDSTKAQTGENATQLPMSASQVKNGTATATVQDKTFGDRYSYYTDIISRTVAQNWFTQEADPRASQGKRTTVIFDIGRDGVPTNIHLGDRSGSPSLDASALHALQRVEGFGPLPPGYNHITVEYTFDYHR